MGVIPCVPIIAESHIIDKICLISSNVKGNNVYVTEFIFVSLSFFLAPLAFFSQCQGHSSTARCYQFINTKIIHCYNYWQMYKNLIEIAAHKKRV